MSETLARRVGRLVSGGFHAILDAAENLAPEAVMNENIVLANRKATKEQVIEAAKKASIHEFIMSLPEGYDTKITEMGNNLSDGEKQRIGIARAFLHNAPIILLDEPTSNLDSLNEAMILQSLLNVKAEKLIILVSHRASTMAICDQVIPIANGRMS